MLVPWCARHTGRGAAWSFECGGEAIESSDGATSPRDVGAIETTVGDPFVECLAEHAWLCIGVQRADVPANDFSPGVRTLSENGHVQNSLVVPCTVLRSQDVAGT